MDGPFPFSHSSSTCCVTFSMQEEGMGWSFLRSFYFFWLVHYHEWNDHSFRIVIPFNWRIFIPCIKVLKDLHSICKSQEWSFHSISFSLHFSHYFLTLLSHSILLNFPLQFHTLLSNSTSSLNILTIFFLWTFSLHFIALFSLFLTLFSRPTFLPHFTLHFLTQHSFSFHFLSSFSQFLTLFSLSTLILLLPLLFCTTFSLHFSF